MVKNLKESLHFRRTGVLLLVILLLVVFGGSKEEITTVSRKRQYEEQLRRCLCNSKKTPFTRLI